VFRSKNTTTRRTLFAFGLLCLLLVLLHTFNSQAVQADNCVLPLFSAPRHFQTGGPTLRLALADFNNDGKQDIAATLSDRAVRVFLGDGAGGFIQSAGMQAGGFSVAVAAGDFNSDGKQDLAVGSWDGTVWIYMGNGNGGFSDPTRYSDGPGEAYEIVVADFDADGKLDLAIGHASGALVMMKGNGSGSFTQIGTYLDGMSPVRVSTADFNNDGQIDLITFNANPASASILLGNGAGGFSITSFAIPRWDGFALADFNHDGNLDFVSTNNDTSVTIFIGDGLGNFTRGPNINSGAANGPTAADFDGDGKMDVAVTNGITDQLYIIFGDGQGGFSAPQNYPTGRGPGYPYVWDLNNDGRPDIVIPDYYWGADFTVSLNNGFISPDVDPPVVLSAPNIQTYATALTGTSVPFQIIATDNSGQQPSFDCNHPANSLFPHANTNVICTAVDACGNRSANFSFNVNVTCSPVDLSPLVDKQVAATGPSGAIVNYNSLNGIAAVNFSIPSGSMFPIGTTNVTYTVTELCGNTSSGSFTVTVRGDCGVGCKLTMFEPPRISTGGFGAVGDFNNDGKLDLVGGDGVRLGDGLGGFGLVIPLPPTGNGLDPTEMSTADFNHDGNLDAIFPWSGPTVLYGDGTGHFQPDYWFNELFAVSVAVGDFNNDNTTDFVASICGDEFLSVNLSDGLHRFNPTPPWPNGGCGPIKSADFNGDGNLDFISTNGNMYFGDGMGNFRVVPLGGVSGLNGVSGPSLLGQFVVADFNSDGKPDLGIGGPSEDGRFFGINIYVGNGSENFTWAGFHQDVAARRGEPHIKAADMNGDGKTDLVTIGGGNSISIFPGDGNGSFGSPSEYPVGIEDPDPHFFLIGDFNGDGKPDIGTYLPSGQLVVLINSTYQTAIGTNSSVIVNNTTLTFDNVTAGGTTTLTPIDPASIAQVPGGFAVSNFVAYEIATTASFTGSVTLAFKVPGPISQADFNNLAILHNENGTLVDVTASTPARDYANLTIYATTTSFSPFYLARRGPHTKTLFDQTKAYKSGSTIPVKLQLQNASNANVSSASTSLVARDLRLVSNNTTAPVIDSGNANPDYTFRYDATLGGAGGGYIYNLSTKGLRSGQYVLSFYAGSDHSFFYMVKFEVK
jgi:hypothetical protein